MYRLGLSLSVSAMGCSVSNSVVNKMLFPAPEESSYGEWSFKGEILWVPVKYCNPQEGDTSSTENYDFPCRLLQFPSAQHLVIYFHRNADDLGSCRYFAENLRSSLQVHVMVVEYPGYGLCAAHSANASQVNKHATAALIFAQRVLAWPSDRIVVLGSCIGSGPAVSLAAGSELAGLVLIAPFLSVRSIVRSHSRLLAYFVAEQYALYDLAPLIRCPTLMFHGRLDKIVPLAHAERLHKMLVCEKQLVSLEGVGHSACLTSDEILAPMVSFFKSIQLCGSAAKDPVVPPWAFKRGGGVSRSLFEVSNSQVDSSLATSEKQLMEPIVFNDPDEKTSL